LGGIVKVTKDKIENRQAYLTVEIEPSELEEGLTGAYQRLVKKANIPGFRKGRPRDP
jgi:trigger factor